MTKEDLNTIYDPRATWPLPDDALFVLAGPEECTCKLAEGKYPNDHEENCWLQDNPLFEQFWCIWNDELHLLLFTLSAVRVLLDYETLDEGISELYAITGDEADEEDVADAIMDSWTTDAWATIEKVMESGEWKKEGPVDKPAVIPISTCSHSRTPVELPNGLTVYASSAYGPPTSSTPDFAVYLDGVWRPDCIAYHIGCRDRSIPLLEVDDVLTIGREVIERARKGQRVEIGCIGGHGRTGLFLGVLVNLAWSEIGVDWSLGIGDGQGWDAVAWVKQNYCKRAIESTQQEWYVDGIGCELAGVEWPPEPIPPPPPCYVYHTMSDGKRAQCDRAAGHEGDHMVYGEDGTEIARWERVSYVYNTSGTLTPTKSVTSSHAAPAPDWDE